MGEVKSVPQALADLGKIHDERGKDYGEDYLHVGEVLVGMFPYGLHLRNRVDFNRFALLLHCITKVGRYATCLSRGRGHVDSLDDLSVYAQLLQRFDALEKSSQEKGTRKVKESDENSVHENKVDVAEEEDKGSKLGVQEDICSRIVNLINRRLSQWEDPDRFPPDPNPKVLREIKDILLKTKKG